MQGVLDWPHFFSILMTCGPSTTFLLIANFSYHTCLLSSLLPLLSKFLANISGNNAKTMKISPLLKKTEYRVIKTRLSSVDSLV